MKHSQNHIESRKHRDGKDSVKIKKLKNTNALQAHNAETHRKGEILPDKLNVYRVKVAMTFMNMIFLFLNVDKQICTVCLKMVGTGLLIHILEQECSKIQTEIQNKPLSVVFDGATHLSEILVIIVRFMNDWKVEQRLVRLKFIQKSMTGEMLAKEVISNLSVTLRDRKLIATIHD